MVRIILVVLNLLAICAFGYLLFLYFTISEDWKELEFLQRVRLHGLLLNHASADVKGNYQFENFNPQILDKVFADVGGKPVQTQIEEVVRVRDELQKQIDASPNKAHTLASILLPLAGTGEERHRLHLILKDQQAPDPAPLQARFNQIFDDMLREEPSGGATSQAEQRDPDEWNKRIAWLLLGTAEYFFQQAEVQANTQPAPAGAGLMALALVDQEQLRRYFASQPYQRAVRVIGLKTASLVQDERATTLRQMAQEVDSALVRARNLFIDNHRFWLDYLVQFALDVEQEQLFQRQQENLEKRQEKLVIQRREDVKRVTEQLRLAQEKTKEKLLEQARREADVFAWQRFLRDALQENLRLERMIRAMELNR